MIDGGGRLALYQGTQYFILMIPPPSSVFTKLFENLIEGAEVLSESKSQIAYSRIEISQKIVVILKLTG